MNTYKETLDFLFSQLPAFQNQGVTALNKKLDKTKALDAYYGSPHRSYKTIHVGGTNGKGSVSHLLASILQSAGYRVGLYTSPHLKDFRERIRVNGVPCSEEYVVDFVATHREMILEQKPSFFEMTVAMAFEYFQREKVDWAVVEVGMGGRFDSTNIIQPMISIVTNISKDHQAILGNSLKEIAREKAGIFKQGVPVIIGEYDEEVAPVFEKTATFVGTSLTFASEEQNLENICKDNTSMTFDWREYHGLRTPLRTLYQEKNINTALTAVAEMRRLGIVEIGEDAIREGCELVLAQTGLKGRWQVLGHSPLVICETGHNEAGLRIAMAELANLSYEQLHFILGVSDDKNLSAILPLLPTDAIYYFTKAQVVRAMNPIKLQEAAKAYALNGGVFASVAEALENAIKSADTKDVIYVGGSMFVVAELDL